MLRFHPARSLIGISLAVFTFSLLLLTHSTSYGEVSNNSDELLIITEPDNNIYTWHHCVGNVPEPWSASISHTCEMHNLCYHASTQEFLYFQPNDTLGFFYEENSDKSKTREYQKGINFPLLGASGRVEDRSRDLKFKLLPSHQFPSDNVFWAKGSHFFAQLHGAANAGHLMLETAIPLVHLAGLFQLNLAKSKLILRDTCDDVLDWFTLGDNTADFCKRFMQLYLDPLFQEKPVHIKALSSKQDYVCFDTVVMGMSTLGLHTNPGTHRGLDYILYRNLLWDHHDLHYQTDCTQLKVIFHNKKGRRNIRNAEQVNEVLQKEVILYHGIPVNITFVTLDTLKEIEVMDEVVHLDVLISAGGSALFHSLLMHNGATVLGMPLWEWDASGMLDFEFSILTHIPFVRFQMFPLDLKDVDVKLGATVDAYKLKNELHQALLYAYSYKAKYYCPTWK